MTMIYLVILVMVTTVQARECPFSCTCTKIPHYEIQNDVLYTSVECKSPDNVTDNLPVTTQRLAVTNVEFGVGSFLNKFVKSIATLPHLTQLEFDRSKFLNITNINFSALSLKYFKISRSQIRQLPLLNLTGLEIFDLSNNNLKVINGTPFRTLISLEILNVSGNAIDTLNEEVFSELASLKCLDLSDNNLTLLNVKVLVPLVNLQYLNLSKNRLEVLNEACFSSLLHLQQLDVSWNRLAHVVPGSLELPSLARLLLAGNPGLGLSRKPTLLVGIGRRLQTVDASRTGLKQVPAALTHSIRTLRLAGNSIRSVNCGDLDSYPLLQLLDFTSNDLEQIEDDAIGRLDSLTILYLTDNKLGFIPHSLPEKLKVLHLESNEVGQIGKGDLQGLQQIEVLILSSNKISVVEESAFEQLASLSTLDLSRNPIISLPAGTLSGPGRLQVLRLSGLGVLPPVKEVSFPLTAPDHLIILDLSGSPGLAHQLLADTAALAAARELQELNLSGTDLRNIRSDLLHFLPQLRDLNLQENELNCTDLEWLALWMRKQDKPDYHSVMCAYPPELWGTLLIDVQKIETSMEPTMKSNTQIKKIYISKNRQVFNDNVFPSVNNYSTLIDVRVSIDPNIYNSMVTDRDVQAEKQVPKTNYYLHQPTTEVDSDLYKTTTQIVSIKPINKINIKPAKKTEYVDNVQRKVFKVNKAKSFIIHGLKNKTSTPQIYDNNIFTENRTEVGTEKQNISYVDERDGNMTIATGRMSMYSEENKQLTHPGMLIVIFIILSMAIGLIIVTTRFTRKKRISSQLSDIEVSSISSVTELW